MKLRLWGTFYWGSVRVRPLTKGVPAGKIEFCWGLLNTIYGGNTKEFRGNMPKMACKEYGANAAGGILPSRGREEAACAWRSVELAQAFA